jgi:hypothetical protein
MVDERLAALSHLAGVLVAGVVERRLDAVAICVGVVGRDVVEQLGQQMVVPFGLGAARHGSHTVIVGQGSVCAEPPAGSGSGRQTAISREARNRRTDSTRSRAAR